MVGEFGAPPDVGIFLVYEALRVEYRKTILRNDEFDTRKARNHFGAGPLGHQAIVRAAHGHQQTIANLSQPAGMSRQQGIKVAGYYSRIGPRAQKVCGRFTAQNLFSCIH